MRDLSIMEMEHVAGATGGGEGGGCSICGRAGCSGDCVNRVVVCAGGISYNFNVNTITGDGLYNFFNAVNFFGFGQDITDISFDGPSPTPPELIEMLQDLLNQKHAVEHEIEAAQKDIDDLWVKINDNTEYPDNPIDSGILRQADLDLMHHIQDQLGTYQNTLANIQGQVTDVQGQIHDSLIQHP